MPPSWPRLGGLGASLPALLLPVGELPQSAPVSQLEGPPAASGKGEGVKPPSSPASPAGRQLGVPRLYTGLAGVPAAGMSPPRASEPATVLPPSCGVARPKTGEAGACWAASRAGVPAARGVAGSGLSCAAAALPAGLPTCWVGLPPPAALCCTMAATAGRSRVERSAQAYMYRTENSEAGKEGSRGECWGKLQSLLCAKFSTPDDSEAARRPPALTCAVLPAAAMPSKGAAAALGVPAAHTGVLKVGTGAAAQRLRLLRLLGLGLPAGLAAVHLQDHALQRWFCGYRWRAARNVKPQPGKHTRQSARNAGGIRSQHSDACGGSGQLAGTAGAGGTGSNSLPLPRRR